MCCLLAFLYERRPPAKLYVGAMSAFVICVRRKPSGLFLCSLTCRKLKKTLFAKYFDSDGIHLNERGVAHMPMRITHHLRQPSRKVGASLPQNKEARPITVHLSRRSSGVTTGTRLWSSVVKDVGPNPAEKPKHTLQRGLRTLYKALMGKSCKNTTTGL